MILEIEGSPPTMYRVYRGCGWGRQQDLCLENKLGQVHRAGGYVFILIFSLLFRFYLILFYFWIVLLFKKKYFPRMEENWNIAEKYKEENTNLSE